MGSFSGERQLYEYVDNKKIADGNCLIRDIFLGEIYRNEVTILFTSSGTFSLI